MPLWIHPLETSFKYLSITLFSPPPQAQHPPPNNINTISWLKAHFTFCFSPKRLSYGVHTVWVTHAWSSRKSQKMEGKYSPRKKSIKISRFPNPFSLMFLCKFVRWEWNCLITLQTWRASLKKITYLSKQGGIYVGVPEMWFYSFYFLCAHQSNERDKKNNSFMDIFFTLVHFLLLFFPFVFLFPPSFHLCLLPVTVNFHTQSWDDSSNDFYQHKAVQAGTKMISPRTLQEGAGYISESFPMPASDDLGTKVLLLFLPGSGMLPEIKFFSLDCTLRLAEPGFCCLGLEAAGSCLFGRNTVRGRGKEQGI